MSDRDNARALSQMESNLQRQMREASEMKEQLATMASQQRQIIQALNSQVQSTATSAPAVSLIPGTARREPLHPALQAAIDAVLAGGTAPEDLAASIALNAPPGDAGPRSGSYSQRRLDRQHRFGHARSWPPDQSRRNIATSTKESASHVFGSNGETSSGFAFGPKRDEGSPPFVFGGRSSEAPPDVVFGGKPAKRSLFAAAVVAADVSDHEEDMAEF